MSAGLTVVNGKGLWNSWTRNFKTPLLACLDLLDNSFDAALSNKSSCTFQGKIHVTPFNYAPEKPESKSGILIINNSQKQIQPLLQILEVFRSEKGKHTESVGENGVGLKQGCATLSDISFVLSKNHAEKKLELGVIAADLQKEDGVRLPSFSMKYVMKTDSAEELDMHFMKENLKRSIQTDDAVKQCVQIYGLNDFEKGISELAQHCQSLISSEWGDHAFCVVLTDLRHEKADHLLNDLYNELPKHYIHVPSNFKCKIDTNYVQFSFWQNRLVELSSFKINIDSQNAFDQEDVALYPQKKYSLSLYMGFDPTRINLGGCCSIYIYSRQSGRLINYNKDARAKLGLVASGSNFSQGMTILVDDRDGNLPLSPSKQDIAFGEETRGKAHEKNVWAYTSACAHLYWYHNVEKVNGLKRSLGNRVSSFQEIVVNTIEMNEGKKQVSSLDEMSLTEFYDLTWYKTPKNTLRRGKGKNPYKVATGVDTLFKIKQQKTQKQPVKRQRQKIKSENSPRPKKTARKSALNQAETKQAINRLQGKSRKNYYESSSEGISSENDDAGFNSDDSIEDIFLSNELKEWAQNSQTKNKPRKKKEGANGVSNREIDYNVGQTPTIPSQSSTTHTRKKAKRTTTQRINDFLEEEKALKEDIKSIEEESKKQKEKFELSLKEIDVESDRLESRRKKLDSMMKAMIDSAI